MNKLDLIIDALSRSVPVVWTRTDETERHAQALAYARELKEGNNDQLCALLRQVHDALACASFPPKREWVELNLNDIPDIFVGDISFCQGVKWAQAKLKEKNNGGQT